VVQQKRKWHFLLSQRIRTQKIQGENQFSKFLEDNVDAKNFLVDYFKKSLSQSDFSSDGV